MMPILTINIAGAGARLISGETSRFGHMWYSLTTDEGNSASFGFSPIIAGQRWGNGDVNAHGSDDVNYLDRDYSLSLEITQEQYQNLLDFGRFPETYGFSKFYHGLANSCIDFTWMALQVAGLNPFKIEGALLPAMNKYLLKSMFDAAATYAGDPLLDDGMIRTEVNTNYLAARSFIRRDPLVLDLDGDGIETTAPTGTAATLFDHDGDGLRTGTGWVKADDAFLVFDKNGNGSIDSGAELFGVDTVLSDGTHAANGFAALTDLDTNHDGVFNSSDAAYTQVRVWLDSNQDGISQAGELFTLADKGITAINLTATASGQILGNGNQIAASGTYTKTDGSTGVADALNLVENPFYREYGNDPNPFDGTTNDPIPLTEAANDRRWEAAA